MRKIGIGAIHQGRPQQHAHCVQVVGHARHDVAGAIALIKTGVLLFKLAKQIVAQVEFDLARNSDENPALRIKKNAFGQRDSNQQASEEKNHLVVCKIFLQLVDRESQHPGKLDCGRIRGNAGKRAPKVSPAIAAHVPKERSQIAKHGSIVRGNSNGVDCRLWTAAWCAAR